jgi:hypothetical protein
MTDYENKLLNTILVSSVVDTLNTKDKETILLWAGGLSLKLIADIIGPKYDGRTSDNPLGSRAMGVRVRKIIKKLQNRVDKGT